MANLIKNMALELLSPHSSLVDPLVPASALPQRLIVIPAPLMCADARRASTSPQPNAGLPEEKPLRDSD